MTLSDQAFLNRISSIDIRFTQAKQIAHRRSVDPKLTRDLGLRNRVPLDQSSDSIRTLDWIEVFSLEILDHRPLGGRSVVDRPNDRRNFRSSQRLKCTPTTFAGDELIAVRCFADNDRLHQASVLDGAGKTRNRLLVEPLSRLCLVGNDLADQNGFWNDTSSLWSVGSLGRLIRRRHWFVD